MSFKSVLYTGLIAALLPVSGDLMAWSGPFGSNNWNQAPWSSASPMNNNRGYPPSVPQNYAYPPATPQTYAYPPAGQQYYPAPRPYPYGYPYKKKKSSGWGNWGGNSTPWNNTPFGNFSGPWDSGPWNPDWFDNRSKKKGDMFDDWPGSWMDPEDPRGSMSKMWDDLLEAPNDLGEMPGGWTAPSIKVPNPVDVGDEFEGSSRDAPREAADQMNNWQFN